MTDWLLKKARRKGKRQKEVIELIGNGDEFYVGTGAERVKVNVVPKDNPTYIRTEGDGTHVNDLLHQPQCK